jgi:hypothetical protein
LHLPLAPLDNRIVQLGDTLIDAPKERSGHVFGFEVGDLDFDP